MVDSATLNKPFSVLCDPATMIDWVIANQPIAYEDAVAFMEARVAAIAARQQPECVWLVEHPPLYTAGTSAKPDDLLDQQRFPVHASGRGGQYTYHGPGQRVAYVMLDLRRRGGDVRAFVSTLEEWLIRTLWSFHVRGTRHPGRVGIWVDRPERGRGREDKIAAIGIRIRHWVSFHGVSLNVDPDLDHFTSIIPCGISDQGVTSLSDLGLTASLADVDIALRESFEALFGPTKLHADERPL